MKGGGGGGGTTIQKTEPWEQQKPYLQGGFREAESLYQTGGLKPYVPTQSAVAPFSSETQRAQQLIAQQALAGDPLVNQARGALGSTIGGSYLTPNNPYFNQAMMAAARPTIENFSQAIMPGIQSQFARSGRYGSGAQATAENRAYDALARNLSEAATQAAYGDYSTERQNQLRAAELSPQFAAQRYEDLRSLAAVGASKEQQQEALTADQMARQKAAQEAQMSALANYMNLIQGTYGGTTTGTTMGGGRTNPLLSGLGGATTGAQVGSHFGSVGTGIGAVVGGLGGLFG